ncbi:phosphoribosylanthranilate isomerase [Muriicola sp. Z0-33]|uniref:phosphoribosylanthranilate isomerase n=1 Tax=Muriicola sp. Z0-33 TaxID=2816957 RepID=UPI0022381324|nr:phosphoribosylanthranilate isomerase [Muriicola sp. Z0-33]MCW5517750.1 phosphoribosylanthranilate isomerase [Muriicola sp. Z0-33]
MYLKVCGMHHNVTEVAVLEPDFLGFIFWEPSKRYFEGEIPPLAVTTKKVGVFVDAPIKEVVKKVQEFSLQMVQLHGKESPEYCGMLQNALWAADLPTELKYSRKKNWTNYDELKTSPQLIKVFAVGEDFDFSTLQAFEAFCDFFMFDTKGKLPGGNGYAFNWKLLKDYPSEKPFFLSGGIGPEDIDKLKEFLNSEASRHCYAIDVNSRFETSPGLKDTEKLKKFIKEFNGN